MTKVFVLFALLAGAAAQTPCESAAIAAAINPAFSWVVTGTPADKVAQVASICSGNRAQFDDVLTNLRTQCVQQVAGTVNGIDMILKIFEDALCYKVEGDYCSPQLFTLLDAGYFSAIQQAAAGMAVPPLPDLTAIMADSAKKAVVCKRPVCNNAIEFLASKHFPAARLSSDVAGMVSTEAAIKFVQHVVNRMRCGCFRDQGQTCFTAEKLAAQVDANGLVATQVCADGNLKSCGRALMQCNDYSHPCPPPATPQCADTGAAVAIHVKNLNKTCFEETMLQGTGLAVILKDIARNLMGASVGDFTCDCTTVVPGELSVTCTCLLECIPPSLLIDNDSLRRLKEISQHIVIQTPFLDAAVPNCKLDSSKQTYGETTVFEVTAPPGEGGANALRVGFSLLVCCVFSLLF